MLQKSSMRKSCLYKSFKLDSMASKKGNGMTLRGIPDIRPLYILPKEPVAEDVLIPGFKFATQVNCMMGFFSSEILVSLAPGLATFINISDESLRLIISPILSVEDQTAIKEGLLRQNCSKSIRLGTLYQKVRR